MNGRTRFECHLTIDAPQPGAAAPLARASGLSRQRIKRVMQQGAVWLERDGGVRRLRRASAALRPGDRLHLYYDARVLAETTEPAYLLLDRDAFSVWYKPAGMLSQGSRWGDHCTLTRWAERELQPQRPAFLVHRLDRDTRGLMLIAHRKRTAAALAELFRSRRIDKRYRAWVRGRFPDVEQCYDSPLDGRNALSRARLLRHDDESDRSLLEIAIETGRKHQIRRHLAAAGFPVIGDRRYGGAPADEPLSLVSCHLAFIPPGDGGPVRVELPAEWSLA